MVERAVASGRVELLVTDLDNTLWDWFSAWYAAFDPLVQAVAIKSRVPRDVLEREIREVHQLRGTSEYSNLLAELPSLGSDRDEILATYEPEIHEFRKARKRNTRLYPRVTETLLAFRGVGVPVAAYTESVAYWTEWRIRQTGLDGLIDVLYSAVDHDFPRGLTRASVRSLPPDHYGLKSTKHRHAPRGVLKPDPEVLGKIIADFGADPASTFYVGDSLMKDVAMAQRLGALDVHARYGEAQDHPGYELLRRLSHWTDEDVAREIELRERPGLRPTFVLDKGFWQLLDLLPAVSRHE